MKVEQKRRNPERPHSSRQDTNGTNWKNYLEQKRSNPEHLNNNETRGRINVEQNRNNFERNFPSSHLNNDGTSRTDTTNVRLKEHTSCSTGGNKNDLNDHDHDNRQGFNITDEMGNIINRVSNLEIKQEYSETKLPAKTDNSFLVDHPMYTDNVSSNDADVKSNVNETADDLDEDDVDVIPRGGKDKSDKRNELHKNEQFYPAVVNHRPQPRACTNNNLGAQANILENLEALSYNLIHTSCNIFLGDCNSSALSEELPDDLQNIDSSDLIGSCSSTSTQYSNFTSLVTTSSSQLYRDKLRKKLDPQKMREAFIQVSLINDESLLSPNQDGDTYLMRLVSNTHDSLLELFYFVMERIRHDHKAMNCRDLYNQTALFLASVHQPNEPLIACYIAATLLDLQVDLSQETYINGSTLIGILRYLGQPYGAVLQDLLEMRDASGKTVFHLPNQYNIQQKIIEVVDID